MCKNGKKQGFTLDQLLICMAIVGLVAAIVIPAVIKRLGQKEYITGLRKAMVSLNSAITISSFDGETLYDNHDIFNYLQQHMKVQYTRPAKTKEVCFGEGNKKSKNTDNCREIKPLSENAVFYTTDGIAFEFASFENAKDIYKLYENNNLSLCMNTVPTEHYDENNEYEGDYSSHLCEGCGSLGLKSNDGTEKPPCLIVVDVNGNRKPNSPFKPKRIYASKDGKNLTDVFLVMVTDKEAVPYGKVAQKALYKGGKDEDYRRKSFSQLFYEFFHKKKETKE